MISIKDIAKKANCHVSTVSRALSEHKWVNAETRERVLAAARELNYKPNLMARSLRGKKLNTIALMADLQRGISYFPEIMEGAQAAAAKKGYKLLTFNYAEDPQKLNEILKIIFEYRLDGILLIAGSFELDRKIFDRLRNSHIHVVSNLENIAGRGVDHVMWDIEKGVEKALEYLIHLGHREIGILSGSADMSNSAKKMDACFNTFKKHGLDINKDLIIQPGALSVDAACAATEKLLASKDRFTALFAVCDIFAYGAMKALRARNMRIPEDVSLVSFDNIRSILEFGDVKLSTLEPGKYEMGMKSCELLIDRLEGKITGRSRTLVIEPELIVRDSAVACKTN